MTYQKHFTSFIIFLFLSSTLIAQKFNFDKITEQVASQKIPFSIENIQENRKFLANEGVEIKGITKNWIYFTQTPEWIATQLKSGNIRDYYFEYSPAVALDDSTRATHHVNEVQNGLPPLDNQYTGKGVIIGLVDTGLDHNHPDFIDSLGNKRVIRYWDQSVSNPTLSPQPYDYGQIWSKEQIQEGTITFNESNSAHGTTVTGISAGNGRANGLHKGMAPDAEIIFVQTDFEKPNWTLTVADACDYIFRVADSLNRPAVINLSVGTGLGSHDGTDPASELMGQLVEEKGGRIIVCAAGNYGANSPFHAQQIMTPSDTSFIWFKNNSNGSLGENTAFFDLWSNINDAQFYYSLGANKSNAPYTNVAETAYRFAQLNVGTPIYDTLYGQNGDRIATLEIYTEYQAGNFHLQGFFSKVDSTDYYLRFSTTGIGKYDLWSGTELGLNKIITNIPSSTVYPPILNYVMPDSLQSLVSSWNCSSKIISVGNIKNRYSYVDVNGNNYYQPNDNATPAGMIAKNSSRGPSRAGIMKPDISATGQMSLASAPLFMVNRPQTYSSQLAAGGYHMRNGGTSMAAPVVAGIAALYLERCPKSTYQQFKEDLHETAFTDEYTGNVPNYSYGYGKVNAFDLLVSRNGNLEILGDSIICQVPIKLTSNIPLEEYYWSTGNLNPELVVSQPDTISLYGTDQQGCKIYGDTVVITEGSTLPNPTISLSGDTLISSEAPNYQWYFNDIPIPDATNQSYVPTENGYYSVAIQGEESCKSFSNAVNWVLGLQEEIILNIHIFPNPTKDQLFIESKNITIASLELFTLTGQKILRVPTIQTKTYHLNLQNISSGAYFLKLNTTQGFKIFSIFKE